MPEQDNPTVVKVVQDLPVIFADGVMSQWYSPGGVCKFHLGRLDPDPRASADPKEVPILQVVMPTDGFVSMVAFCEHRLDAMIEAGIVTLAQGSPETAAVNNAPPAISRSPAAPLRHQLCSRMALISRSAHRRRIAVSKSRRASGKST